MKIEIELHDSVAAELAYIVELTKNTAQLTHRIALRRYWPMWHQP